MFRAKLEMIIAISIVERNHVDDVIVHDDLG